MRGTLDVWCLKNTFVRHFAHHFKSLPLLQNKPPPFIPFTPFSAWVFPGILSGSPDLGDLSGERFIPGGGIIVVVVAVRYNRQHTTDMTRGLFQRSCLDEVPFHSWLLLVLPDGASPSERRFRWRAPHPRGGGL